MTAVHREFDMKMNEKNVIRLHLNFASYCLNG